MLVKIQITGYTD